MKGGKLSEQAIALHQKGKGQEEIARQLGVSRHRVRCLLGLVRTVQDRPGAPTKPKDESKPTVVTYPDALDPILRGSLIRKLRNGWRNIHNLSADLRCPVEVLETIIGHLQESGYIVQQDRHRFRIERSPEPAGKCWTDKAPLLRDGWRKIGIVSDSHMCSKFCRLDVLEAAYDHFKEERITDVYHAGNLVDGECPFNRYDLLAHGVTDQALYTLDHYPQRSGITTHFITGECHEGWWGKREGIDFGRYLSLEAADRGRKDLHYLGFLEADVSLPGPEGTGSMMRVFHPGGGSAYAISYKPQKIVESLQGGEKPAVMIVGHYHKLAGAMNIRNVWVILAGCTMDQNAFMRKQQIEAHIGFLVLEMQQDAKGAIRRIRLEETNYFDRGYHGVMELPC